MIKKYLKVPISKKRYKERGYNQSLLIAKEIAKEISKQTQYKANIENKQKEKTNLELVNNCLIKTKNIRHLQNFLPGFFMRAEVFMKLRMV